nr:MAX gene-associated protein isoform X1 [Microcebus murinus]XP_020141548.1 MAX gene-associated protein isoform X1 [Microcebus murinus]XP_020141550.1 MAX gene-associated protein isoform X1 [Microcebus murinus]XP_020141551.1 MAX gene-associated protein isoform X1 [Microcebus murinus]XP_020141552.1 MAX gene-associated protein isoform X1 [Microcebus murinus]XP_020141553.1 MAX gene-associated protein isoform X1 [Microcebus murinus]XP_020141554.1 MAX gene-associated protein isoform X1 [Microcebus
MEEKQIILANQDGGTVAGAAPTFFVILKQPGNGKTDQGILVTNRDACALASSVSSPGKSKGKICLPADCTLGGITVTLDNNSMWNEFYHRSTEMILTKQGRRMFPYCRYWITGLDSNLKYILVMDISPVDNHRYKWNGRWWEPSGKAEPHVLGRVFIHPESPSTGHYWMHQPVSFYKLKLTNNTLDQEGHIILHSMHRYLPRLHLVPAEKATEVIQLNGPGVHTFTFPQTEFFAVTAYQNIQITQLKIDYNPFAKGFRDDGLNSKPQRDGKQKNSSDQEGNSVPSSPGHRVRLIDGEGLEIQPGDLDPVSRGHETFGKGLEKTSLNIKRDFLGFMDNDSALEVPQLKQEVSESLVANNFEDGSRIVSPLDPNGSFNVVIKEEPLDDYDYEIGECPEGVTVKQEETDEETDVYSNSDDDPILEKQLKRHNKVDNLEADHLSSNWLPSSPSGVAKAKMFKLDSGKMPVVYLEPCAVTKSTVKISELPDNMLSASRKDKSSMLAELEYLPTYIENSSETGFCLGKESENGLGRHSPDLRVVQKYPLLKETPWKYPDISDSISTERILDSSKDSTGDSLSEKEDLGRKRTTMLKIAVAPKAVSVSQNAPSNVPGKRGRPRKLKLSKAGRPPKNTGKSLTATKNTPVGPGSTFPDVKPDLEDVDGVLFVSFESKEALDIHAVDGTTEEPSSLQASTTNDPGCRARISQLEKELIEDLKSLRHKQVIHPGLQEVGLKLNSVDPTMSIDLKYLGVQLPLAPATSFPFWNLTGTNPASPDAGFPFVSRTGKTNDFTKIKGWRGKFHSASASRNEGGNSESSLKNRSAFCSDKLDEYLENEGKLMETNMGFSANAPTSPVVYQLPTKSTSYVRTLDSVLKKQSTISPSTSYSLKPHSVPAASRKAKSQNKQATFSGRTKSSYKSILPYSVSPKQKHSHMILGDKVTKNFSSTISENQVNNLVVPTLDENVFPKQISLRQAQQQQQQQQQGTRPPGLSKSQVKLMDLEDCALWEGKPRTYITEERADVSLTTLLTAQASLKTKPIHTIIRKRAPPCNNDFCRLGCVCSSLALEKRQPAHCRRPDCMFGCTCLKRKVVLVKGGSKAKHFQRKSAHRDPVFYDTLGEEAREEEEGVKEEEEQLKEKKKRKKLEYTICETEPEQPVRHYPLWVKVEGEVDPEPVYIPTPSVIEPMKPLLLPQPEVLSTTVKGKLLTGIKPARAYTPKPNPVIREEDKDPVYLYFESMMTCARVRVYERKKEEQRQPSPSPSPSPSFQQQSSCHSSPENYTVKEPDSEQQPLKQLTCDLEEDSDKSQEKSWKSSCNEGESSSTSYMHQRSPGGPTKLIEIISDCNWEEDRNKILSILSQHINSSMPQSLKVGSFIIELASQRKSRGEKNPPVYSSRVKISMPSCQDQDDMAEKSGSETPDGPLSPGKMDDISPVQTDALDSVRERLHGGKGLPFYAGLSPAGKLVAYKRKPSSSTSGLIQNNCVEYIEDDEEQVDIETIEELSEEINVAHMKTTAAHTQSFKQPCRTHSSTDEKAAERSRKAPPVPLKLKSDYWSDKLQKEAEAFAYYRRTHTANERRRRGEMRDLFEKLKATLGLLHSSKVSKSLILTRAFSEIQGLTDQADKLIGQKNLLTRKRNILIRKVSSLSGKTEEVVLKKLEYIYAKQQALEAQKRKKKMGSDEFDVSHRSSKQQEGSSASSVDVGQMFINNRRGKPLILSRKRDQATENTSPSNTPHTSANLVMTPQGQLLTLKGPLFSGPVVTVSPGLLEADLKPQVGSSAMPQSENDDLFMMPRIVNVTSLATDGSLVDMGGSKYPHEVPDGKPPDHLTDTIRNKDNSLEDSGRISSRGNHRDGRMTLGPTQVFLANKDSGFPQIVDVSSMQEAQEFLPKKISGDIRGIQYKWKENESRGERLKSKQSSFHKLKMKDLKDSSIEMELRKVTSAIEEAALDSSELLTNMEDEDDTDETLTSLLNEIAFLNQQLNDDTVSLAELPSTVDTEFPGDARRGFISKLPSGNSATFQVGHLGTGLKELPDVQGESDSTSPLLLHLEDDDFSENEKQLAEPASEPDVLKIVIDSEIKDSLISHRKTSDGGKSTSDLPAEPESVSSPPLLHMRTGLENSSSTDTLWRPMPKLAPLGLKVANPCNDADGQSLKVMPCLAPIAAKVGSVGHKMNLTGSDQEGRESKVMPTLAPVLAKLGNSGVSPSSAGK